MLEQNNIKGLILDVDNTLIDFDKKMPEGVKEWAENLKQNNIKLYIVSNSMSRENSNNSYYIFCKETTKRRIKQSKEKYGVTK